MNPTPELFLGQEREEALHLVEPGSSGRGDVDMPAGMAGRPALDALVDLGAQVKISYEVARTRLHAKAWLFHRHSGLHTAYIGSSNPTRTAQVDGLEWNVRVSAAENPEVIERFAATFGQFWQEPEFEDYAPRRDSERLDHALSRQRGDTGMDDGTLLSLLVDVAPKPHQAVALEALEAERLGGYHRNLVVAEIGTGKTWITKFSCRRYGCIAGRVSHVSTDVVDQNGGLNADESGGNAARSTSLTGTSATGPVYQATIDLDTTTMRVEGADVRLRAGMTVVALIFLGKQRIVDYVLEPVIGYRETALRER